MLEYLQTHWLAFTLLLLGIVFLGWGLLRRFRFSQSVVLGLSFLLFGVGDLVPGLGASDPKSSDITWSLILVFAAIGLLIIMTVVVVLTGMWSAPLGYFTGALLLLGLGSWGLPSVTYGLNEAGQFLASLDVAEPWWLLGLLVIPVLVIVSHRRLTSLGPVRRWLALGLRCLLIVFVCLALAEIHARQTDHDVTVLFLWDRSLSVPEQSEKSARWNRIVEFINDTVAGRDAGRNGDRTGVIVFGRYPRLELPPARVPKLNLRKIHSQIDDNYTDIAAALKLALASFPEGASKRIVLLSDGNENLGNAVEQARIAKHNGVRIDVVGLAAGRSNFNEVLVERIEAPPVTDKDARVTLRIVIKSFHPEIVVGNLYVHKTSVLAQKLEGIAPQDRAKAELPKPQRVELRQGLNVFVFQQPGLHENEAFTYEAEFKPLFVKSAETGAKLHDDLPGDLVQNNRASTMVMIRGQRHVLLLERKEGEHQLLMERLEQKGLKILSLRPSSLPKAPDELAKILTMFDCVILANVPAYEFIDGQQSVILSDVQQSVIRSNVSEQGAGLVMIGGPESFGQGGWQDSELEKALPVTCELTSKRIEGQNGLVLIMHASEMADGNAWQKKIARLSIEKLSARDRFGLIYWENFGAHHWHIPFQLVGADKKPLFDALDSMNPGDMQDVNPALTQAHAELTNPKYALGTKHIIFISDGDHWVADQNLLRKIGRDRVTLTTVCTTSHGNEAKVMMKEMANAVVTPDGKRGRFYDVDRPEKLPQIYMKESRLVSKAYVHDKKFQPKLNFERGPTKDIGALQPLHGFIRTSRRQSPLVEESITTPKIDDDDYPILAYWQYGLGKVVAFASDCRTPSAWDVDWAGSDMHKQFWRQTVEWCLRDANTSDYLTVTTEQRGGKVHVVVEALDKSDLKRRPLMGVELQAGLTALSGREREARKVDLKFEQKAPGRYEAEFQAEEVGSYFLNVKGSWPLKDARGQPILDANGKKQLAHESVRTGITIPYSPEFAEVESNPDLLRQLASITGGKYYTEDDDELTQAAKSGEIFRPVASSQHSLQSLWYYLVLLTALVLFFDVAVRRISIEPAQVQSKLQTIWARVRGRQVAEPSADQFLERLKSRKAHVDETLAKEKGTRRFERAEGDEPPPPAPDAGDMPLTPPLPKPPPPTSVAPEKEAEAGDYASRLMRAKKRAQDDRDKK